MGDTIIIQGETNFNTDNQVMVEIYPASFGPTKKYEPSMTGGSSIVVPVRVGGNGVYFWAANFSSEGWKPDQYMVRAEIIGKDYQETSLLTLSDQISSPKPNTSNDINLSKNSLISSPPATGTPVQVPSLNDSILPQSEQEVITSVPTTLPVPTQKSPFPAGALLCALIIGGVLTRLKM